MNKGQDTVIDDDEETWYVQSTSPPLSSILTSISPLCIEEFDLSDKNFRPCPCGYQVRPLILAGPQFHPSSNHVLTAA